MTPFQERVRAAVAALPRGTVVTYGELAAEIGHPGAGRAVGSVLRDASDGLPWWRVVPASGRLVHHLAARQAARLVAEGVAVDDGRVLPAPSGPGPASGAAIHHLELYVSDLERSSKFWGWLLARFGYEPFQEWDDGISFATSSLYMAFVEPPHDRHDDRHDDRHGDDRAGLGRRAAGLNHIAFSLPTAELVDELRTRLVERDVRLLYDDRYPHAGGRDHYALFFEDPDGLKVEVVAQPT